MKNLLFIVSSIFIFSNCSKNKNNGTPHGYPMDFYMYFNFIKADQQLYQKMEITPELRVTASGNLEPYSPTLTWSAIPQTTINNQLLFGPFIIGGVVEEVIKYQGQSLVNNQYHFIRFNNTGQDTLHIVTNNYVTSEQRFMPESYDVFYNSKKIITLLAKDYSNGRPPGKPWVIEIQK